MTPTTPARRRLTLAAAGCATAAAARLQSPSVTSSDRTGALSCTGR